MNPAKIQQEPPVASSSAAGQDPASTRPTTYDEILKRDGVLGVLKALKQNRGKEFADAQQALLAARKSFSNVKYEEVMEYFKLQPNTADDPFKNWEELEVPHVCLPAEVFDDIANQIYRAHANFGSPANLKNEAATAGFLSGPFQAVLCLFGGVLRDQPEQPLPATTLSSGGRVEVEILCRDSALFYLREFKHDVKSKLLNAIAQVCCELYGTMC
ncbi:hypothetical protein C8R45DRAFT_1021202 [Mycena sanguinolenta]|nr:hypothetical protein C8R45DRAFT_1021202 [Mycena sanguinolenta]